MQNMKPINMFYKISKKINSNLFYTFLYYCIVITVLYIITNPIFNSGNSITYLDIIRCIILGIIVGLIHRYILFKKK